MLRFFIQRQYPRENIAVETVVIKSLGSSGQNKLRCDAIVYSVPRTEVEHLTLAEKLKKAILIAEVKRDSTKKEGGISQQLEPALRQLPSLTALGVYWDDLHRVLLVKGTDGDSVHIDHDSIANLPVYGGVYQEKPLTFSQLAPPDNLMSVLTAVANVMRSNGVNDEQLRYKETVKLILARYCDERAAAKNGENSELAIQVNPGLDLKFRKRIDECYATSAKRYSNAKTLFSPVKGSELEDKALREVVSLVQGLHFSAASTEVMQQLFMSFVPAVFKKSLDQYFTPLSLIDCIVDMVRIGPNDKVADPGMGTADFLTAALTKRILAGDDDIDKRIFGADIDPKAYDLAVINMILHKDGQTGLHRLDSIENHTLWADEIDVALCNPPFGEKSIERRTAVLKEYQLGHRWELQGGTWKRTEDILPSQQLGILFLERCFKMLSVGGRVAIILPEGYLCTASYGYVRQWILSSLRVVSLVELPRRIFLKSDADLRSTIMVAEKLSKSHLAALTKANYPIHAELVRKVGYKLGAGFPVTPKRASDTGNEVRDESNKLIPDSDFVHVSEHNAAFSKQFELGASHRKQIEACAKPWFGARIGDVLAHAGLDLKPRRLTPKALANVRAIEAKKHFRLRDVATLVSDRTDIGSVDYRSEKWRLVEGQDIRAVEGVVLAQEASRGWRIAERKGGSVFRLVHGDIIVGLVRPERRNVGMLVSIGDDIVGSPDGIAVVRLRPDAPAGLTREWLFMKLRSEEVRLQFWTESGGTSYGKLTDDHILNVRLSLPDVTEKPTASVVKQWFEHQRLGITTWEQVGSAADRKPILNSPIFGLEWPETSSATEEDLDDGDE